MLSLHAQTLLGTLIECHFVAAVLLRGSIKRFPISGRDSGLLLSRQSLSSCQGNRKNKNVLQLEILERLICHTCLPLQDITTQDILSN